MKARWLMPLLILIAPTVWASLPHHWTLPNGLNVYVIEDHRAPVVYSSLWYKVGSADESNGTTGLSHMLEHMLFRGTKNTPDGEYARRVHAEGGKSNAMTSRDFTMYHSAVPVTALPAVLGLEADRMRGLVITNALLKRELKVVKEERRMRVTDNPLSVLYERFNAAAFVNNPYHNPVIGWPSDLANYTVADVQGWYDKWYHPNNASLILVGDITPAGVKKLVQQSFSAIPKVALPVRKPRREIAPLGLKRILVHYPANVATLRMGYFAPGLAQTKHAWRAYALEVLVGVLGSTPSSRLNQSLVRDKRIATDVSASYSSMLRYLGQLAIRAVPAPGHSMTEVEQAIEEQIDTLHKKRISRAELKRAKAEVVAEFVYQQDSLEAQALNVGYPVMAGLPWRVDRHWVQNIEAVTTKQVRWVARHYLLPNRLTVGYLEPTAAK